MPSRGIEKVEIVRFLGTVGNETEDFVVVEEPLEIRVLTKEHGTSQIKKIGVVMRTPGADEFLTLGLLFAEGIIQEKSQIAKLDLTKRNTVTVSFSEGYTPDLDNMERNLPSTSSCGICGKNSIDGIKTTCYLDTYPYDSVRVSPAVIYELNERQLNQQTAFSATGGIHACTLFTLDGSFVQQFEDIGRHNALDKLIGYALTNDMLPLSNQILFLSGRAGFEMLQKAAVAGIKIVVSIGAPSSLAVELAEEWNITLIGFLRGQKFNVYTGDQRIVI